jgi:hypothetical protein
VAVAAAAGGAVEGQRPGGVEVPVERGLGPLAALDPGRGGGTRPSQRRSG